MTVRTILANKPDVVVIDHRERRAMIVAITIPHNKNLVIAGMVKKTSIKRKKEDLEDSKTTCKMHCYQLKMHCYKILKCTGFIKFSRCKCDLVVMLFEIAIGLVPATLGTTLSCAGLSDLSVYNVREAPHTTPRLADELSWR